MFRAWCNNPSPCFLGECVDNFMLGHEMLSSTSIGGPSSLEFRFSQPPSVKETFRQGSEYAHPTCLAPISQSTTTPVRGLNSNPKTAALRRTATDALHSLTSTRLQFPCNFVTRVLMGPMTQPSHLLHPGDVIFPFFHSWRAWLERPWGHIDT